MYILKESVAAASDDTSELRKKAIADATRQNRVYDVIRRSIGKHCEKLSSLDTNGLSVVITLSSLYYNSAAVRLQGIYF
jgi:type II secretory pathway component PulM